ncbi:MAG TPA: ABC transporter permease [Holophagaceae bacterium]|nr:ABC transporter permease [Holophagaceae bacterium]
MKAGPPLRALARACGTLAGVWLLLQGIPRWLPEDPARIAAGEWATEREVAAMRSLLRLDLPWPRALAANLRDLAHGSLGESLRYHRPVAALLREGFPVSLRLALLALVLSALLAWTLALWRSGMSRTLVAAAVASPVYVLGPLLLWVVALRIPGLPVAGIQGWSAWILPCTALAVPLAGHQARILASRIEFLREAAGPRWWRGSGVPDHLAWRRWLLPAAAGPWLTVLGLQLGALLGGAVLVETIFAIPGLGSLLVGALNTRDLPLMQACVLLGAALFVGTQLLVAWVQGLLDPRMRT